MCNRILSREEREFLLSDAIQLIYKHIHSQYYSSDTIEKALLQAVIIGKMNQCCVDAPTLAFLLERVSECEGMMPFEVETQDDVVTYRYC